jgi:hypothetical protein
MFSTQEEPRPEGTEDKDNMKVVEDARNMKLSASAEDERGRRSSSTSVALEKGSNIAVDHPEKGRENTMFASARALRSLEQGDSEVEVLANRIETKRANRIPVVHNVRDIFLKTCRIIAESEDCQPKSKIPGRCLIAFRDDVQTEVDNRLQAQGHVSRFLRTLGFLDETVTMLQVLDRAVDHFNSTGDDFFYYQDFNYYNTYLVSRWPWMRNSVFVSCFTMFFFYLFTPIWFCHIVPDEQVCPSDPDGNRPYYGWLTALYFASTTMSTVGYGT